MMMETYIEGESFNNKDFKDIPLAKGEYENCNFIDCDFSHSDFSGMAFIDCDFLRCNLSLVKVAGTAFRDVVFKNSKLLGIHFDECNQFGLCFNFDNCNLGNSSFYKVKLKKIVFRSSQLIGVDFSNCDLTASVFDKCDLSEAIFDNTNIEKADFRSSFNYSIDPELNRMKKARFSLAGLPGLLSKYGIVIQ